MELEFVKLEVISSGQDTDADATMRLEYYRALSALGCAISDAYRLADAMPDCEGIQADYLRAISISALRL